MHVTTHLSDPPGKSDSAATTSGSVPASAGIYEEVTRKPAWRSRRKTAGCLSASQFGSALGLLPAHPVADFIAYERNVAGTGAPYEFRGNAPTAHGNRTEYVSRLVYECLFDEQVDDGGFFVAAGVDERLACSPDGIVEWEMVTATSAVPTLKVAAPCPPPAPGTRTRFCAEDTRQPQPTVPVRRPKRLLEIKSPFRGLFEASKPSNAPFGIPQGYMAQMQGQMHIAGADTCDFFVYSSNVAPPRACAWRVYRCDRFWAWALPKLLRVCDWISQDPSDAAGALPDRQFAFEPFDFALIRVEPLLCPIELGPDPQWIQDAVRFPYFSPRTDLPAVTDASVSCHLPVRVASCQTPHLPRARSVFVGSRGTDGAASAPLPQPTMPVRASTLPVFPVQAKGKERPAALFVSATAAALEHSRDVVARGLRHPFVRSTLTVQRIRVGDWIRVPAACTIRMCALDASASASPQAKQMGTDALDDDVDLLDDEDCIIVGVTPSRPAFEQHPRSSYGGASASRRRDRSPSVVSIRSASPDMIVRSPPLTQAVSSRSRAEPVTVLVTGFDPQRGSLRALCAPNFTAMVECDVLLTDASALPTYIGTCNIEDALLMRLTGADGRGTEGTPAVWAPFVPPMIQPPPRPVSGVDQPVLLTHWVNDVGPYLSAALEQPRRGGAISIDLVEIPLLECAFVRGAVDTHGLDTDSAEVFVASLPTILNVLERALNLPLHRRRRARSLSANGGLGAVLPSDLFDDDRVWRCVVWFVIAAGPLALRAIAPTTTTDALAAAGTSHAPPFDSSFDPRLVYDGAAAALTAGVPPTLIFPLIPT